MDAAPMMQTFWMWRVFAVVWPLQLMSVFFYVVGKMMGARGG